MAIGTSIEITDKVSGVLSAITNNLYRTVSAFEAINEASDNSIDSSALTEMKADVGQIEAAVNSLNDAINETGEHIEDNIIEQREFNDVLDDANTSSNKLLNGIGKLVAAYASIQTVKEVLNISDELTQTTSRINMMNDGLQSTEELLNSIYLSAQDARGSFSGMADVVARFGNNAGSAFSSSAEIVAFSNLIQKQMTIAGASTSEASSAMLQLSQALGSGVLRGDELNSIFEQAPNLIQNIAKYIQENEKIATQMADVLGISYEEMSTNAMGHIRDLASEGQLSAEVVKAAIFSASDDINAEFAKMPMTWSQIWQSMQNTALMKFQPVLQRINDIANSNKFQKLVTGVTNVMSVVGNIVVTIFDMVASIASFAYDNWSLLAPVIGGVLGILTVYLAVTKGVTLAQTILKGVMGAFTAIQTFVSIGWGVLTGNTAAASAAQFTYNSALLACPITWIIIAVIALIAVFYLVIAVINKFTGSTISATGIIFGAFATLGAHIINNFVVPVWNYIVSFINFFGNVFNDPIASIKILFYDMMLTVIGYISNMASAVEKVINKIPGVEVDITSGLDNFQSEIEAAQQKVKDESGWVEYAAKMDYIDYGDAWNAGYSFGEGIENKVSGLFGGSSDSSGLPEEYSFDYENIENDISDISDNTAAIGEGVDITNEQLKYLRDVAEMEAINQFTTAEIKVDMVNHNNVSSGMDLDGMVTALSDGVTEAMQTAAEGVHY